MSDDERKPNYSESSPYAPGTVIFRTGTQARTMSRGDGIRKFLPFRVTLECQLSLVAEVNELFEIHLYQEDSNAAIKIASKLLKAWYVQTRRPMDGYPKPINKGIGEARRIPDDEFIARYREARERGKDVRFNGDINDPVAYALTRPKSVIFTPASGAFGSSRQKKIILPTKYIA